MSEYQYIAFQAIDAPVSESQLQFMRGQSTRAKVTPWTFENTYDFGDFHGNATEMLRRGYDFHFHFANFGQRTLMIRLPAGLPNSATAAAYLNNGSPEYVKDPDGPGGVLVIDPCIESGEMDDLHDPARFLDRLLPLRAEIINGDLRPLYLAHLAVASDGNHDPDSLREAPVPAGLDALTRAQRALAELYCLDDAMIAVAAQTSPPMPKHSQPHEHLAQWLRSQPDDAKVAWLSELVADPHAPIRINILAEYQKHCPAPTWPTVPPTRTISEIQALAQTIRNEHARKDAQTAARRRAADLARIAANPAETCAKVEQLIKEKNIDAYRAAVVLLADLRSALANTQQSGLAEQYALKIKERNPRINRLTAELRRHGFLAK